MSLLALNACAMKYAVFEKERKESGHTADDNVPWTRLSLNIWPSCIERATGFQIK